MSYVLQGVIAPAGALRPCRALVNGVVVDLGQCLGLVPMTPALFDEVRRGDEGDVNVARMLTLSRRSKADPLLDG
ncbi:hypothetical protein [Allorhizocola rhizosphaerae]|uniref:hypothetical protein n=1 Tax=Allorhizocola rhizosphaerae TaxID=1872709 RepID=UPI0013C2D6C4|nr:hypothetical protein [Allorhizocola rhizosphaerae]